MDKKKYKKTKYPNIYKNIENGSYAIDLSLGYNSITGKRVRTTRTGINTEREAKELLKNLEKQKKIKQNIEYDYLFEDLLKEYYDWCLYSDKEHKNTVDKKRGIFKNHIVPFFGKIKLTKIDGNQDLIKDWHKCLMKKQGINNDTRNTIHKKLSAYINWLIYVKNIIKINPCPLVKNFKLEHHEILYYDNKQIEVLRNTIINNNDNQTLSLRTLAFLDIIYTTGLRLGELQGLQINDFEFDILNAIVCNETVVKLHLMRSIVNDNEVSDGKTDNSLDIMYIGSNTMNSIIKYIKYCQYNGILFNKDDFIFKNPKTNLPYTQHTLRKSLNYFINKSGLPHRKIKELRNSTASYLINHGYDLKDVQEQLRHSSYKTTEKHYAKLYEENKINRAKTMNETL